MATATGSFDSTSSTLDRTECDVQNESTGNKRLEPSSVSTWTLIETERSTYLFLVTSPAERLGLLVGGAVGECPTSAVFRGAIADEDGASRYGSQLETTWRMVFEIKADDRLRQLITSRILNVVQAPIFSHQSQASHRTYLRTR
jgi:hypothetical protein